MKPRYQSIKTLSAFAFILVLVAGGLPAWAQETDPQPRDTTERDGRPMGMMGIMQQCPMMRGMMSGGQMKGKMRQGGRMGAMQQMHGRMMDNPRVRSLTLIHLLPVLEDSLNLSADQATRMKKEKEQFKRERADLQEKQKEIGNQIDEALEGQTTDLAAVHELLGKRAALEADQEFAIYETAARMKEILTEGQREKLTAVKPMAMHRALMANMSMMEMMQMMRAMPVRCPMMENGKMEGGPMRMDDQMRREN